MEALVLQLGIQHSVAFCGARSHDQVVDALQQASIAVIPADTPIRKDCLSPYMKPLPLGLP